MNLNDRPELRKTQSFLRTIAVGVTAVQLLPGRPDRLAVTFSSIAAQRYTVFPRVGGVLDAGLTIHAAQNPFTTDIEEHGDFVTGELWVIASAAAQSVTVLETFLIH